MVQEPGEIIIRQSDIDLAISGSDQAAFRLDVEEYTWTLLKYDILDLDRPIASQLREAINREGRQTRFINGKYVETNLYDDEEKLRS